MEFSTMPGSTAPALDRSRQLDQPPGELALALARERLARVR